MKSGAGTIFKFCLMFVYINVFKLRFRYGTFNELRKEICQCEGGIDKFTSGYKSFGIHVNQDNSVSCKEWAPGARQLYLYGDFSKPISF